MKGNAGRDYRWAAAVAVALGVVAATALLFRVPQSSGIALGGKKEGPPEVQLARPTEADRVLKDEALIRDLRPLFLPTPFNTTLAEPRREAGHTILDEERPRLQFTEAELGITRALPPAATLNGRAAEKAAGRDVLAFGDVGEGVVGFGRQERKVERLPARGGFVEAIAAATGERVLAESLPPTLGPAAGKAWEPMELFAAVDAAGLAAPLVVTEGSRVDEVDAHFRKILAQTYRIGERLPPGFFRIVVGP